MKEHNLFTPLLKTIDKVFFGFDDLTEKEPKPQYTEHDVDEEFVVERSSN